MAEAGFVLNGELVVPGDTRCVHWPSTCAEAQSRCPTAFQFCDFCVLGSPEPPPVRAVGGDMTPEELSERIAAPERIRAEKLREAVMAIVEEHPHE